MAGVKINERDARRIVLCFTQDSSRVSNLIMHRLFITQGHYAR